MEQTHKKSIGYGFRGWLLILFQAIAFVTYTVCTNYPLNILNGLFDGFAGGEGQGMQLLSMIYTIAAVVAIILQLLLANKIGKAKSIKLICLVLGAVSLVLLLLLMVLNPFTATVPWLICYGIVNVTSVIYGTFAVGILIGQWFPTRKGTVMGIATFAFPIANGLLGPFASSLFNLGPDTGMHMGALMAPPGAFPAEAVAAAQKAMGSSIFNAFLPFFIVCVVGWLVGLLLVTDYPEQCGAYRDNDKSMTPEIAKAMMMQEIENKKTTVWKLGHTLACRDFWFITLPLGFLLMFSVGTMTLTQPICAAVGIVDDGYTSTMALIMIFGLIGSYVLGILDTRFGTRRSVMIALVIMLIAGILGFVSSPASPILLRLALICLALFMGASSNYTVSAAAQYWRREDFSSVFAAVNPIANILASSGPMVIARLIATKMGYNAIFLTTAIIAVICLVLVSVFKPAHIKATDDKYRQAAGKPLDDVLVGRK